MRKIPENSTPIANEIIESLAKASLSPYEFKVVFAVVRKTYGWDKSFDWISLGQLEELTGIPARHCSRTLKKLLEKKILIKKDGNLGINKATHQWCSPDRDSLNRVLPKQGFATPQTGNQVLPKQGDTKETITKETIQKKDMAEFWKMYPNKKGKVVALRSWDKLTEEEKDLALIALPKHCKLPQWQKNNGQFIPHPSTWLNQHRWEDELGEDSTNGFLNTEHITF